MEDLTEPQTHPIHLSNETTTDRSDSKLRQQFWTQERRAVASITRAGKNVEVVKRELLSRAAGKDNISFPAYRDYSANRVGRSCRGGERQDAKDRSMDARRERRAVGCYDLIAR